MPRRPRMVLCSLECVFVHLFVSRHCIHWPVYRDNLFKCVPDLSGAYLIEIVKVELML